MTQESKQNHQKYFQNKKITNCDFFIYFFALQRKIWYNKCRRFSFCLWYMKILASLNNFLTKNRKNILYIFWFFFVFFMFFDVSLADTWVSTPQTQANDKSIFIQWINGFLKIVAALLWLLTFLVGLFLYPEWTSWTIVWLGWSDGALKTMWIMMSNVVYFVFALIFIWIAFMNIIWKDWDTYWLKTAMPRFIIWVLIVPFTWFFVQFVLSISSILTVWVLSLPYDTFKDTYMKIEKLDQVKFCKDYIINTWTLSWSTFPIGCKEWSKEWMSLSEIVNPKNSDSLFWITTIYTYWVMALDENGKLYSQNIINGVNDIIDLWVKALFDLVFLVVYAILMIALALALFVRWVYLWFYAMLSPVFWLLYFFKKEKDWIADGKFSISEFISLAFVPVYVSAALAFWLLFLFAAGNAITTKSNILDEEWKKITFAWFTYTIEWPAASWWDVKKWISKLIEWFQWTFWTLLLQVFWLAILWMAVMAALKSSKVTANVSEPFAQFGNSIWQLAMKAPTYMPIIPTGNGMMSAASLGSAWQSFQSTIAWEYSTKWSRFWQDAAKNIFWIWDDMLNKLDELIKKPYTTQSDIQKGMQEWLQSIDSDRFKNDPNVKNKLADLFKELWAETWLITKIKWAKDVNELSQILQKSSSADWKTDNAKAAARTFLNSKSPADIEALIWWGRWTWPNPTPPPPTPWNWQQTININTWTTQAPVNTAVDINLSNWVLQLESGKTYEKIFDSMKGKVKKADFEKALRDKWVSEAEINKIVTELKDTFFTV